MHLFSVRAAFLYAALPLLILALAAPTAAQNTGDASVARRLNERGMKYKVDDDGDFKVTYSYSKEKRTQLVFVSGRTQSVGGFRVRRIFSPAALVDKDLIDGKKALELIAESNQNKLGSWEIAGNALYFTVKLPDNIDAAELESAMDIAAQTADDMEQKISGDRDDL